MLDKGIFYLPILFIMNHAFQMYGIAFSAAVTLIFALAVGAYLALRWNKTIKERALAQVQETSTSAASEQ